MRWSLRLSRDRRYARGVTMDRSIGPRCNIGPDEIARRRRSAIAMSVMVAMVAALLLVSHASPLVPLASIATKGFADFSAANFWSICSQNKAK